MRKNKDISGYQILCILAIIDGDFDPREGSIVVDYVSANFPLGGDLDGALDEVSSTQQDDYPILFQKCSEDFYADSTEKERLEFIDFAIKLIKADDKVQDDEVLYLNKLYQYWDIS